MNINYLILDGTLVVATYQVKNPATDLEYLPALVGSQELVNIPDIEHTLIPVNPYIKGTLNWSGTSFYWQDTSTLQEVKVAKLLELKIARDQIIFGGFGWDGSTFDSDQTAQTRLMGLYIKSQGDSNISQSWRLQDNSWRVLTAVDIAGIWATLNQHLTAQFAHFAQKETEVIAATTKEQVATINW